MKKGSKLWNVFLAKTAVKILNLEIRKILNTDQIEPFQ